MLLQDPSKVKGFPGPGLPERVDTKERLKEFLTPRQSRNPIKGGTTERTEKETRKTFSVNLCGLGGESWCHSIRVLQYSHS